MRAWKSQHNDRDKPAHSIPIVSHHAIFEYCHYSNKVIRKKICPLRPSSEMTIVLLLCNSFFSQSINRTGFSTPSFSCSNLTAQLPCRYSEISWPTWFWQIQFDSSNKLSDNSIINKLSLPFTDLGFLNFTCVWTEIEENLTECKGPERQRKFVNFTTFDFESSPESV